jgi:hypothetical protein
MAPPVKPFWPRIARGAPDACWPWTGPTTTTGDPRIPGGGYAHRVAYQAVHGRLPPGATVTPCPQLRICCNPAHLTRGYHRLPRGRGPSTPRMPTTPETG